ncbi:uncharacterized protein [Antedon mediterranea]|uniref:uncharacterized protein isoform X2 n=1 Tax=Antedon mediterranea TaxID=105859 RepID=UPI003AF5906E
MAVRIKLIFDGVDIKKCMFLVDSKHVIIKDLEKGIKKRFPIEKSSKVSLFIDDFILPSKDGIELIHDNDIVVVRVRLKPDISVCLDECETKKEKIKKRKRKSSGTAENSQLTASTPSENDRDKKQLLVNESVNKKKKVEEVNDTESAKKNKKIDKKKKHKFKKSISEKSLDRIQCNSQTNTNDETEVISKKQAKSSQLEKVLDKDNVLKESKKKKQTATMDVQSSSSSDSSSSDTSSSDGNKRPRIKWNTELSKTKNNITTNKQGTKNAVEVPTASVGNKTKVKVRRVKENGDKKHIFFESDPDSSSSDDDDTDLGNIQEETGNEVGIKSTEVNDKNKEDRWEGEEIQEMNIEVLRNQEIQKEVVEKPTNLPPPPSRDYSKLNPLIGPPRVGDVICYKILELSASYMPEVSAYKEGKVIEYDATSQSVTLELCEGFTSSENMKREGRFEMELDEEYIQDKTEHENVVSVQWSAVMAPRLIT